MPTKAVVNKPARKKSSSGWKQVQSNKKKSRMVKLALGILALILGLLIISWSVRFTQSLFSPWKLSSSQHKTYIWNGEFNLNLLVRSEHISLLSYNPKEEKIQLIDIPDETFLEVPHGFGMWQLRAVYELGESQKQFSGDSLLKETLTSFLAVPIDGFLDLSSLQTKKSSSQILDIIRNNPFSGLDLLPALKTDLTVWELFRLKLSLDSVRFDKVTELSLEKFLDKDKLPDGTEVLTGDPVKIDSALVDLADSTVVSEHKSIAVLNATDQPLLAQKAARLINNLGGNVIITNNAPERLKKTTAIGEKSATLKRLKQIFANDDKISGEGETASRAQINLLVGEDYAN